jgi:hypothetical protein
MKRDPPWDDSGDLGALGKGRILQDPACGNKSRESNCPYGFTKRRKSVLAPPEERILPWALHSEIARRPSAREESSDDLRTLRDRFEYLSGQGRTLEKISSR